MGKVGDQNRRAVRLVANRPPQTWFLANHEREKPPQSLVVGLRFNSSFRDLWDFKDLWDFQDLWFRHPGDAVVDRGAMPSSQCFGFLVFTNHGPNYRRGAARALSGDGGQDLCLGEICSSKIVGTIRAPVRHGNLSRHRA